MRIKESFGRIENEVVKKFLKNICKDFRKELEDVCIQIDEDLLQYREKTMSSILFPVLRENSTKTLMELHYRKDNRKKFLDFYCLDSEIPCSYFIEFKHCFDKSSVQKLANYNIKKWNEVNLQIEDLDSENSAVIDGEKSLYGLSIFMLVAQTHIDETHKKEDNFRLLEEKIKNQLGDSHWSWIYEVSDEITKRPKNEPNIIFSHIALVGKINEIIKI
ncbi:MAG: hypothetical protein ACRCTS_09740 [Fusobacteriaceae bacterium]